MRFISAFFQSMQPFGNHARSSAAQHFSDCIRAFSSRFAQRPPGRRDMPRHDAAPRYNSVARRLPSREPPRICFEMQVYFRPPGRTGGNAPIFRHMSRAPNDAILHGVQML